MSIKANKRLNKQYVQICKVLNLTLDSSVLLNDSNAMAAQIGLDPLKFEKLFLKFTGVKPEVFLSYTTSTYAKSVLKNNITPNLFHLAHTEHTEVHVSKKQEAITIIPMTPEEYKRGGALLNLSYSFHQSAFGTLLIASTANGICYLSFNDNEFNAIQDVLEIFPKAQLEALITEQHLAALSYFTPQKGNTELPSLTLHLKGTDFQLKVWQALLQIPSGNLQSYKALAAQLESPNASRALGTAIGKNPVALLIPCHRVLQSSGQLGGYRWGLELKSVLIGLEAITKNKALYYGAIPKRSRSAS